MYSLVWLVAFVILLFVELLTSDSFQFWFVIGCFTTLVVSLYTNSLILQFIVFTITSFIVFLLIQFIMSLRMASYTKK